MEPGCGIGVGRSRRRVHLAAALVSMVALLAACQSGTTWGVAGNGTLSATGDGGPALQAGFGIAPLGLAASSNGAYLIEEGCTIREVDPAGTITTAAGRAGSCPIDSYSGDGGPATAATLDVVMIRQLVAGSDGSFLFTQQTSHTVLKGVVRKVAADGTINTVTPETTYLLTGLAGAPDGTAYYTDALPGVGTTIREIGTDDSLSTVYRGPDAFFGLAYVSPTTLVACDYSAGDAIERLDLATGTLTPTGVAAATSDLALVAAPDGTIYEAQWSSPGAAANDRVLRIDPDGTVTAIAGTGDPDPVSSVPQLGVGTSLDLTPQGLALTANGNLLISSGRFVYRLFDAAHAG